MKDCNNQEIQVGDTVKFLPSKSPNQVGVVTQVSENWYIVDEWSDGGLNGVKYEVSNYVKILKKANQTSSNIHELQKKAQEDIQACISKYITEFNNLGFEFDATICTHDIRTISECKPSQLFDVKVTAVLK